MIMAHFVTKGSTGEKSNVQSVMIVDNKCDILHHLPRQMKSQRLAIEKKIAQHQ